LRFGLARADFFTLETPLATNLDLRFFTGFDLVFFILAAGMH